MAVRTSMAALIARMRLAIVDPSPAVFTDQQIQDQFDFHRTDVRYALMHSEPTFTPGPTAVYLDFYTSAVNWEDDYILTDMSYTNITGQATTLEPIPGHWAFPTQPNGLAVRITGKFYDFYGAAADLLDNWAIRLKLNYRFESDNQHFYFEQQVANIIALSKQYRAMAQPRGMTMIQGDANPDQDGGGVTYPSISSIGEFR